MKLRLPWRLTRYGGLLNTVLGIHLRRPGLRRTARRATEGKPADITVIVAHRNRADYRLTNALRSIGAQRYPAGSIRTVIVDYGSSPEQLARLRAMASEFGAACVEARGGDWNKAHCLNIGLRRVETPFVMITDVDVVLAANYLSEAVTLLQHDPLGVVYSKCHWLPRECTPDLQSAAGPGGTVDTAALKPLGRLRVLPYSTGIVAGRTCFFHAVRGLDEYYELYGGEDDDLAQRFQYLGLRHFDMADRSYYLHQWHPRREGVQSEALAARTERNNRYLATTHTIVRNPRGWGGEYPSTAGEPS